MARSTRFIWRLLLAARPPRLPSRTSTSTCDAALHQPKQTVRPPVRSAAGTFIALCKKTASGRADVNDSRPHTRGASSAVAGAAASALDLELTRPTEGQR